MSSPRSDEDERVDAALHANVDRADAVLVAAGQADRPGRRELGDVADCRRRSSDIASVLRPTLDAQAPWAM